MWRISSATTIWNPNFPHWFSVHFSGIQSVVVTNVGITSLGLRSLKEISDGDVTITKNPNLCYTNKSHWERLFKSSGQRASVDNNANSATCGASHFRFPPLRSVRNAHAVYWTRFWSLRVKNLPLLLAWCLLSAQRNNTCDRKCTEGGCWGPGPDMCFACSDYSRDGSCVDSCNILEGWGRNLGRNAL